MSLSDTTEMIEQLKVERNAMAGRLSEYDVAIDALERIGGRANGARSSGVAVAKTRRKRRTKEEMEAAKAAEQ